MKNSSVLASEGPIGVSEFQPRMKNGSDHASEGRMSPSEAQSATIAAFLELKKILQTEAEVSD